MTSSPAPAGVGDAAPTVSRLGSQGQTAAPASVGFTSPSTSFPQLRAVGRVGHRLVNHFTLHGWVHPAESGIVDGGCTSRRRRVRHPVRQRTHRSACRQTPQRVADPENGASVRGGLRVHRRRRVRLLGFRPDSTAVGLDGVCAGVSRRAPLSDPRHPARLGLTGAVVSSIADDGSPLPSLLRCGMGLVLVAQRRAALQLRPVVVNPARRLDVCVERSALQPEGQANRNDLPARLKQRQSSAALGSREPERDREVV
jgi:hypothetical protein